MSSNFERLQKIINKCWKFQLSISCRTQKSAKIPNLEPRWSCPLNAINSRHSFTNKRCHNFTEFFMLTIIRRCDHIVFSTLESIIVKFDGWLCAFPKPLLGEKLLAFFHQFSHKGPICNSIYRVGDDNSCKEFWTRKYVQKTPCDAEHQARRKVWKSKGEGASSNVVGIICPPPLIKIGLTDLPNSAPMHPRSDGPVATPRLAFL